LPKVHPRRRRANSAKGVDANETDDEKEPSMKTYQPISWKKKLAFAAATLVIAAGVLELVAGAMKFPDADTMAIRERVLATQSERARQIRELERGEVRMATTTEDGRI
jgi:hypothetical protein